MVVVGSADSFTSIMSKVEGAARPIPLPLPFHLCCCCLLVFWWVGLDHGLMDARDFLFAAEKLPAVFYYTAVWCGPCKCRIFVPKLGFLELDG